MKDEHTPEPDLLEGEDKPEINRDNTTEIVAFEDTSEPDDGIEKERQDAYDNGTYHWNVWETWEEEKGSGTIEKKGRRKKELYPYSSSRDSLFSRLRHAMGAPDIKEAIMDTRLWVGDAHLILFLCAHDELYLARRIGQPDDLLVTMFAWVDKNVPAEEVSEAVTLTLEIFFEKTTNTAEQAPDDNPHESTELGN